MRTCSSVLTPTILFIFLLFVSINSFATKQTGRACSKLLGSLPEKIKVSRSGDHKGGEDNQFSLRVTVRRGKEDEVEYAQTNHRGLDHLQFSSRAGYPEEWSNWDALSGKRVLDVGCGGGRFVRQLIDRGINAVGIDISLPTSLKQSNYKEVFYEADATKLPFEDKIFDFIYENFSLFSYEGENQVLMRKVMLEYLRVLRVGGAIRIHPGGASLENIRSIVEGIPELKLENLEVIRVRSPEADLHTEQKTSGKSHENKQPK